jgi:hypothetical protein
MIYVFSILQSLERWVYHFHHFQMSILC